MNSAITQLTLDSDTIRHAMTRSPNHIEPATAQKIAALRYKARIGHRLTLVFYITLLALFSVHQWLRPEGISLLQWSVQCLPLLLFWFGLRVQRRRTYLWLCFVILLYFIKGVEGVMGLSPDLFDSILLTASTSLFIASMMTARWLLLAEKIQFEHLQSTHSQ
ncbi:DUF2069 domain-containing protein [Marinagarivorans algicola]|uniref:DUF2069 domain-containing protein n=1 Tax=Marinagarivorans algicola TaxID=1513270 RepID=UPI0006B8D149|nr:DUF2069 domain-containing protein [Marinagarivorans algicola]